MGGGVLNITMKSGTNQFHGSGFEYFVNEDLNAGEPYTNNGQGGNLRSRTRKNDFGYTVGGPVWIPKVYDGRNKSFFFVSWEEYRVSLNNANDPHTVPTPAMRVGNFSADILPPALGVVLAVAAARTWTRNRDWQDEATLWAAAVAFAPGSARVQSEYGRILMTRAEQEAGAGDGADAQAHFATAVQIYPSYSLPLDGLAMIDSVHERFAEANALYGRAMQAWPGNFASLTNWASLLWDEARRTGTRSAALRKDGKIAEADALVRQADAEFQQAVEKIDRATAMMPSAQAHLVRAMIRDSYVGDPDGAIAEFEEVLRLAPNHPQRAAIESELQRLRSR